MHIHAHPYLAYERHMALTQSSSDLLPPCVTAECEAGCANVTVARKGACDGDCVCYASYMPVCGENNVTFGNGGTGHWLPTMQAPLILALLQCIAMPCLHLALLLAGDLPFNSTYTVRAIPCSNPSFASCMTAPVCLLVPAQISPSAVA
jgi:hypothetical protein